MRTKSPTRARGHAILHPTRGGATLSRPHTLPKLDMAETRLQIIEPNLVGASGHYSEFVRAVRSRADGTFSTIEVMCSREARPGSLESMPGLRFDRRFGGHASRLTEWTTLRECCRSGDPFLVLTAKANDALLLAAAGAPAGGLEHARLFFHWREDSLAKVAIAQACRAVRKRALAIAPTHATATFLRATGWARVCDVPYPAIAPEAPFPAGPLRHLLVAGAARMNKGIDLVADLAARLARRGDGVGLLVQTTGKRRTGGRGDRESAAIAAIGQSRIRGLRRDPRAPDRAEYAERFRGALVLTPYDPVKFADNVSGIALDALLHGAPVVATAGSWQAHLVERFGAGTVMRRWDGDSLEAAVDEARDRWGEVSAGAQRAATTLREEHDPAHLVRVLAGDTDGSLSQQYI